MSLADTAIKKAKPEAKQRKLYNERGLSLLISPKGGKWWRFKYLFDGKEKLLFLGTYPDVSLKDARERRDEAQKQVAAGIDPGEHRKAKKSAGSGKFCSDRGNRVIAQTSLSFRQGVPESRCRG